MPTQPKLAAFTHLVFLASNEVKPSTVADLIVETRQTYSGPLVAGGLALVCMLRPT